MENTAERTRSRRWGVDQSRTVRKQNQQLAKESGVSDDFGGIAKSHAGGVLYVIPRRGVSTRCKSRLQHSGLPNDRRGHRAATMHRGKHRLLPSSADSSLLLGLIKPTDPLLLIDFLIINSVCPSISLRRRIRPSPPRGVSLLCADIGIPTSKYRPH